MFEIKKKYHGENRLIMHFILLFLLLKTRVYCTPITDWSGPLSLPDDDNNSIKYNKLLDL